MEQQVVESCESQQDAQKLLGLFEAFGIELEYMIVDSRSLQVKPICDKLLYQIAGDYLGEVECGTISYSNELALHVVELKTTKPEKQLDGLDVLFQEHIKKINELLLPHHAKLLPTACHPWMDPQSEMKLWPHEQNPIYELYHSIFDCRGHGWSNLQSMHINLPFKNDSEFNKLHTAIRVLLPILPALAASSPILEGKFTGKMDKRLDVYRQNQKRIPRIAGQVIPELVKSYADYQKEILEPIYKDIAPLDPQGLLQFEWLNSRGAIARFERMAIEIRVLDLQECPRADIAVAKAIEFTLKRLTENYWSKLDQLANISHTTLVEIFSKCVELAEKAPIENPEFLALFQLEKPILAGELWRYLLTDLLVAKDAKIAGLVDALEVILREGTLSSRILRAWQKEPTQKRLEEVYAKLASCLESGELFT